MGNYSYGYQTFVNIRYRQADSIYSYRAFVDQEAVEFFRDLYFQNVVFEGFENGHSVDVSLYYVTTETCYRGYWAFEVDRVARSQVTQVRDSQGFWRKVG